MDYVHLLKKIVYKLGFDVRRLRSSTGIRTTLAQSYSLLVKLGFRPKTVIDVGVAQGTMELYDAFPGAYFLLIEPLKIFESNILEILRNRRGGYILAAAGSQNGTSLFHVHRKHVEGSSLYKESMGLEANGTEISVPIVRIDDILNEKQVTGPYLIKVDVQGAELDVLEGCQNTLVDIEVAVLEVSLFQFMVNQPQFYDVIAYMKNRGFVAFDIILGWNRPLDNALGQIDIVFVKEDGQFRLSHSYSTVEQMIKLFPE